MLAHSSRSYARVARAHGIRDGQTGTLIVIQRLGSGLQLTGWPGSGRIGGSLS
jgi:hypothetical protein